MMTRKRQNEGSSRDAEEGDEEMQGGGSQRNTRSGGARRRFPGSLPLNHFWDEEGFNKFYDNKVHRRRGSDYSETRIKCGNERTISSGLALSLDFLRKENFDYVASLFEFQGWDKVMGKITPYEPSLIRQFYHNLVSLGDCDEPRSYKSKVYNHIVHVSPELLSDHFFNSNELLGACLTKNSFHEICPGYDPTYAKLSLLESNCEDPNSSLVSDLTVDNRLIHHILIKLIAPRSGSFAKFTDFDIGLMYFLRNHIKICLPDLMFGQIAKIAKNPTLALVYGMHLTDYLVNGCNIPSNLNDAVISRKPCYDKSVLRLLFTQNDETQRWERKYVARNVHAPLEENPPPFASPIEEDFPQFNQGGPSNTYAQFSFDPMSSSSSSQPNMYHMMLNMQQDQLAFYNEQRLFNDEQRDFNHDMRMATDDFGNRLDNQQKSIDAMNDELAKLMKNFKYDD